MSELQVDAIAAGRTPTDEERARLESSPEERARVEERKAAFARIRTESGFARVRDTLPAEQAERPSRRRAWMFAAGFTSLAAAASFVLLPASPPEVRAKGGASVAFLSSSGPLTPPIAAGTRLRLSVPPIGAPYVVVVAFEGGLGEVLFNGRASDADGALPAFDVTPGDVDVLVVHAETPVDISALLRNPSGAVPGEVSRVRRSVPVRE